MLRIATLGPSGTNHELVTARYMEFLEIDNYSVDLVDDFADAVKSLQDGRIDIIVQCAVHPATPATMGTNFREIFVSDCFIADSRELGVLSRRSVESPTSIGLLMPATANYTDLSRWPVHRSVRSLPLILDELLAGRLDSGLVYTQFAARHPAELRIDEVIGSPDDVWIVYSKLRSSTPGGIVARRDTPFTEALRRIAGAQA